MKESLTLDIDQPAPVFSLTDIFGQTISLKDYLGKKILISFFRHAGCPYCNVRVHRLQRKREELQKLGLEMIFFFESDKETLSSSDFHKTVAPIPIISDPEKVWYNKYGVEDSKLKFALSHVSQAFSSLIRAKRSKVPIHNPKGKESWSTIPAEFLIDQNGIVKKVHYARGLNDRINQDAIFQFAKAK